VSSTSVRPSPFLPGPGAYGVRYSLILGLLRTDFFPYLSLASANFLDGTKIEPQRILLAVYPLLWVGYLFVNHLLIARFQ
jgi:hypothetical protein